MAIPQNRLAPGLDGRLSDRAAALVAERLASGRLSPFACHDASAIRRDPCERDRDTALRPAFVRDAEKIVHLDGRYRSGEVCCTDEGVVRLVDSPPTRRLK